MTDFILLVMRGRRRGMGGRGRADTIRAAPLEDPEATVERRSGGRKARAATERASRWQRRG